MKRPATWATVKTYSPEAIQRLQDYMDATSFPIMSPTRITHCVRLLEPELAMRYGDILDAVSAILTVLGYMSFFGKRSIKLPFFGRIVPVLQPERYMGGRRYKQRWVWKLIGKFKLTQQYRDRAEWEIHQRTTGAIGGQVPIDYRKERADYIERELGIPFDTYLSFPSIKRRGLWAEWREKHENNHDDDTTGARDGEDETGGERDPSDLPRQADGETDDAHS